jgi:superfamily I DNA and/or RNA helicase
MNEDQVEVVTRVMKMLDEGASNADKKMTANLTFGILSGYRAQIEKLESAIKSLGFNHIKQDNIKFSTIDGFQGKECDIIIFSTVRSQYGMIRGQQPNPEEGTRRVLGFLEDPRRLNVVLTRAKRGRILVGNKETLEVNDMWKRAIKDAKQIILPQPVVNRFA